VQAIGDVDDDETTIARIKGAWRAALMMGDCASEWPAFAFAVR